MSHKLQSFELQAGEGRRGSDASESNGCCFDAAIVQQLVSMGAWQAMQHLSALHGEISESYEVPCQPARATLVRVPKDNQSTAGEEEKWDEEE